MNPFLQAGSHADRTSDSIREALVDLAPYGWEYIGSCVGMEGSTVDHMTAEHRQVALTAEEFWELLGEGVLAFVDISMKYAGADWSIRDDNHVTYWRSSLPPDHEDFPSRTVIFFDHSSIEYVWVERYSWEKR